MGAVRDEVVQVLLSLDIKTLVSSIAAGDFRLLRTDAGGELSRDQQAMVADATIDEIQAAVSRLHDLIQGVGS